MRQLKRGRDAIDNFDLILDLCDRLLPSSVDSDDTFLYTELLDRRASKGNKTARLVRTYYHKSRADLERQAPHIRLLCDATGARAYIRLAPRSFKKVGKVFTQLVVEAALVESYANMRALYARACGTVTPNQKLWLFDVDEVTPGTEAIGKWFADEGLLIATVPSRKGLHYITRPHHQGPHYQGMLRAIIEDITLHKDNPTNLYIPASEE